MTKKKWLGSLLNLLIPGLGYVYARNVKKGLLIYILFIVVVLSLRFISFNFILFLVSLTLIVACYLYAIISGYRDVKSEVIYEPAGYDKWFIYVLIVVAQTIFVESIKKGTLDKFTPINFARIPTPAMDPTLQVGDFMALKRTKTIERNDVAVFWFPDDINTMYVKRCIGLPGDSLQIKNSKVWVNGSLELAEIELKYRYIVRTDGSEINSRILKKNQTGEFDYFRSSPDSYEFFLTDKQAKELKQLAFLKEIELSIAREGESEIMIYPKSEYHHWNTDFYGPIYIPKKGDRIDLTNMNIDLYLKCIEFENDSVVRDDSGLKVNGQLISEYEFKENYFFMMGDNRHNSLDSRYWGLLPQELVIGKALYLYWGRTSYRIGKRII